MMEQSKMGGRELDEAYRSVTFEPGSGNIEAAIIQRTELFFARMKREASINYLAEQAAEENGGWSEVVDIIPLGQPGRKPMRLITELRYYDETTIASVIQDHQEDGTIAVSFQRHILTPEQYAVMYDEINAVDTKITQGGV